VKECERTRALSQDEEPEDDRPDHQGVGARSGHHRSAESQRAGEEGVADGVVHDAQDGEDEEQPPAGGLGG